jgi:hypothetical protein
VRIILQRVAGAVLGALVVLGAPNLRAIETGYGEDPVPDTYRSLRPPYTAYGMDPIPVKSPLDRWQEWRAYRDQRARGSSFRGPAVEPRWKWWHRPR